MPPAPPHHDGYAIALEEARRALDEQERAVAQLSTRAGLLISAAAIVTSFLGGPVLARGTLGLAGWIAVGAFAGLTVTTLVILRPRRAVEVALHPALLIGNYIETRAGQPRAAHVLRRELALHLGASIHRNEQTLDRMMTIFNIGSVLLAIEIVAWVASIIAGL